jgi:hypothetical protein
MISSDSYTVGRRSSGGPLPFFSVLLLRIRPILSNGASAIRRTLLHLPSVRLLREQQSTGYKKNRMVRVLKDRGGDLAEE